MASKNPIEKCLKSVILEEVCCCYFRGNMSPYQEPLSPEQFISTQVRQITALSLSERSGEALKLALELVEQYQNYPLVHRCIAKVYQRMDQLEVATKHHEIADRLSEEFFRNSNPLIAPKENDPGTAPKPPKTEKNKTSKKNSTKPSFNEQELLELRQQLIESTQEDVLKTTTRDIDPIPVIKLADPPTRKSEFVFSAKESGVTQEAPTTTEQPSHFQGITLSIPTSLPLKYAVVVFREIYAREVYQRCNQDLEGASKVLGISRENLAFLLGL